MSGSNRREHLCSAQPPEWAVVFEGLFWNEVRLGSGTSRVVMRDIKFCPFCGERLNPLGSAEASGLFPVKKENGGKCQIPGCDAEIVRRCKCLRSDSQCREGHEYHYGRNEQGETVVHVGTSDHGSQKCCFLDKK